MRKILLLAIAGLPLVVQSQTNIITDNFESYTAGELLAANSDLWTTWSGGVDAEDALISNAQSTTGANSIHVSSAAGPGGPTDLVLPFPEDYTSGVYDFSLKIYMVSGKGGYFNIQQTSTDLGAGFKFAVYFDAAGGGYVAGGGTTANVSYTPDAWTSVLVRANLDEDMGEAFINSTLVHTWQWSLGEDGTETVNSMGGIDIYGYAAAGAASDFYIDDVVLVKAVSPAIIAETFENYFADALLAANSDLWTTWSGGVDAEDALLSNAQATTGTNSIHVSSAAGPGGPTDLVLPFPQDYTSGVYDFSLKMYMVGGKGGYFNIQQTSTDLGAGFKFAVYFDTAGGGYVAGGGTTANVSYTPDAWTSVLVRANLNEDKGEAFINSTLVHTWQWSLGEDGTETVNSMGGVDIYGYAAAGAASDFYIDDVSLTESFPTGITSSDSKSLSILIAPNPSNGQFSVSINDLPAGNYQLELIDMLGRLIRSESLNTSGSLVKNFDESLPGGIYYVRLIDGVNATTKKIVVN